MPPVCVSKDSRIRLTEFRADSKLRDNDRSFVKQPRRLCSFNYLPLCRKDGLIDVHADQYHYLLDF